MTQFYCFTCDRYRDSNNEDMADYSGDEPVCGDCVQEDNDNETRRHETGTQGETRQETSRPSAETMVRGPYRSILKRLGRI